MTSQAVRMYEEVRGTWAVMWGILSGPGPVNLTDGLDSFMEPFGLLIL